MGVTITNKAGEKVHTGVTPITVTLKRRDGFFKAATYDVTFKKSGFPTKTVQVNGTVNGWYVANTLLVRLIGLLIVDSMTGAMYALNPSDVNAVLDAQTVTVKKGEKSLTVMWVSDISTDVMKRAEYLTTL